MLKRAQRPPNGLCAPWPARLLCACVLALYFAFLTKTYYWDGVLFSLDIESVHSGLMPLAALFHPNHLLYNALGYLLYSAVASFWPGVRAISVLQGLNVVLSAIAAYVLFLLARLVTNAPGVPLFCGLLFAAGATWWKFSTDADSYILSVLLLLFSALCLLSTKPRLVATGLFHAAAMLFHELAIFSYVPVLAFILTDQRLCRGKRITIALAYCIATSFVVGAAYWLCYHQATGLIYSGFVSWVTSYSHDKSFTNSVSDIVAHYLTSYIKLFAGGKLSLIPQFFSFLECAALVLCAVLLICGILLLRKPGVVGESKVDRHTMVFLWSWFIAYALFLGAWDPGSAFHKLFLWPPVVLLIGAYTRKRIRVLTTLAAALAAWNFGAFIYPHSHAAADPVLVLAQKIDRELPKDAFVLYRVFTPDDWYLDYFAPGRKWRPLMLFDDFPLAHPVCYETTAIDQAQGPLDPHRTWELVDGFHHIRLSCLAR